jgi:hypothetical protein
MDIRTLLPGSRAVPSTGLSLTRGRVAVVFVEGTLVVLTRRDERVRDRRGSLYGFFVHPQRDRVQGLFGYGFDRDQVVLSSQAQEPSSHDVHEAQLPVVIYVEVIHVTEVPPCGGVNPAIAEFVPRGARVLVPLQPDKVHRFSFPTTPKYR